MNVLLGHNKTVHEFLAQMPFTKQQSNRQTDSYFIETVRKSVKTSLAFSLEALWRDAFKLSGSETHEQKSYRLPC